MDRHPSPSQQAASAAPRIKATKIKLARLDSPDHRFDEVQITRFDAEDLWRAADAQLAEWAQTAPPLGYHQVAFTVYYRDTRQYHGVYQLTSLRNETPDLAGHIASSVQYKSALNRPSWAPEAIYCWFLEVTPTQAHQYADFYEHYEIGTRPLRVPVRKAG